MATATAAAAAADESGRTHARMATAAAAAADESGLAVLERALATVQHRPLTGPQRRLPRLEHETLTQLASHRWQCSFMAPLWGLDPTDAAELKKQLKLMRRVLAEDIHNKPLLCVQERARVSLAVLPALGGAGAGGPVPGLRLQVRSGPRLLAELLLCGEPSLPARQLHDQLHSSCLWLPLQLARGDAAVLELVRKRWLLSYGGSRSAAEFTQLDMMWFTALWMGQSGTLKNVELVYAVPEQVRQCGLDTVTITLPAEHMQLLTLSVHPLSAGPNLRRMEMAKLHVLIHKLVMDLMGIPLTEFKLVKLNTPLATVSSNGQFQATSPTALQQCLPVLLQLAAEYFSG